MLSPSSSSITTCIGIGIRKNIDSCSLSFRPAVVFVSMYDIQKRLPRLMTAAIAPVGSSGNGDATADPYAKE